MGDVPETDGLKPIGEAESLVRFAGLVLDLNTSALARESGEAIRLTRGELALLRMFIMIEEARTLLTALPFEPIEEDFNHLLQSFDVFVEAREEVPDAD